MRRNLVVIRAGESSLHLDWDDGTERNFDLLVSYYRDNIDLFEDGSEYQHVLAGPPWKGNAAVCKEREELLAAYDFIAFADDDIMTSYADLSRLFNICSGYSIDIATPAITVHTVPDLAPRPDLLLRYMSRGDLICPVFRHGAFGRLVHTFSESQSGWGLPQLWGHLCPYPVYRTAVIDAVSVRHTRPFSRGRLQAGGIDPVREQYQILVKYGLLPEVRHFFGEVPLCTSGGSCA